MGRRDYGQREKKKGKKDPKKIAPVSIISTAPVEVEVIKKGKKKHGEAEEEE
jgi:hypothetical protein